MSYVSQQAGIVSNNRSTLGPTKYPQDINEKIFIFYGNNEIGHLSMSKSKPESKNEKVSILAKHLREMDQP